MAINIKDADTDRLARELAELTGQPITVAVRIAIQDRLAALRRRETIAAAPDLRDIIARGRQRRIVDDRLESDILGYDDDGLPA